MIQLGVSDVTSSFNGASHCSKSLNPAAASDAFFFGISAAWINGSRHSSVYVVPLGCWRRLSVTKIKRCFLMVRGVTCTRLHPRVRSSFSSDRKLWWSWEPGGSVEKTEGDLTAQPPRVLGKNTWLFLHQPTRGARARARWGDRHLFILYLFFTKNNMLPLCSSLRLDSPDSYSCRPFQDKTTSAKQTQQTFN